MTTTPIRGHAGTGADGGGDPAQTEATLWVNRSEDCPEAPAQVRVSTPLYDATRWHQLLAPLPRHLRDWGMAARDAGDSLEYVTDVLACRGLA